MSTDHSGLQGKENDHDLLMKLTQAIWGKDVGLATHVTRNTIVLYGDGTEEHPGIVNELHQHIKMQEVNEKKRYRNLQIYIAFLSTLLIVADRVLAFLGIK
jgi:hypothetical protein